MNKKIQEAPGSGSQSSFWDGNFWGLKLMIWIGTLLSLLTPFIRQDQAFFPFVGVKSLFFMGCVQVIFFTWLALAYFDKNYRPKPSLIISAVVIYIFIFSLATVFSVDPIRSFWSKFERMGGLLMHLHLLGYFLVLTSFFRQEKQWEKIFFASVGMAMVMCLTYFLFLAKAPWTTQYFASSQSGLNLGNKSFLGTYLLFNAFFAIYLLLKSRNSYIKIFAGICFTAISIVMKFANTRAMFFSFLGAIFLACGLFFWYGSRDDKKKKNLLSGLLLAGAIFAFLFIISVPWNAYYNSNWLDTAKQSQIQRIATWPARTFFSSGGGARLLVWKIAWPQIWKRPLLGWGPETFEFLLYEGFDPKLFMPEWGGEVWFDRAHNIIIDTLASVGILGFLSYLGIFAVCIYTLHKKGLNPQKEAEASIFIALLAAYFVQNLTVFDMVSSFMLFYLTLGYVSSFIDENRQEENDAKTQNTNTKEVPRWPILLILICVFTFSFQLFIYKPYRADLGIIKFLTMYQGPTAQQVFSKEGVEDRINFYQSKIKSGKLGMYQVRDFLPDIFLEIIRANKAWSINPEAYKKEFDFYLEETKENAQIPMDYRGKLKLGYFSGVYGASINPAAFKEGEGILINEAARLSPRNPQTYWFLAQIYIFQNRYNDALNAALKGLALDPEVSPSRTTAIEIAKLNKQYDLAIKLAKDGVDIYSKRQNIPGNNVSWSLQESLKYEALVQQLEKDAGTGLTNGR